MRTLRQLLSAASSQLIAGGDDVKFRRHGRSLAMYRRIPELQSFWDGHWGQRPIGEVLAEARTGRLGELEYSLTTFLPRHGVILEAGCGTGRVVQALKARGYDVVGVDFAIETLVEVQRASPELAVEVGDLTNLRWPDGSFGGYVSIGVMEHFFDGPEPALQEAFRVLEPGGRALISVPYKNRPRSQTWKRVNDATEEILPDGFRFYQDHVDVAEFRRVLGSVGFEVVDIHPYGMFGALLRDLSLLRVLDQRGWLRYRLRVSLKRVCAHAPSSLRRRYSHMMMFVCERPVTAKSPVGEQDPSSIG